MSGFSDETNCPNCGNSANRYTDWKPFDHVSITCYYCGLMINPIIEYMTLKELNVLRKDYDMNRLRKLPEQNKQLW